MRIIFTLRKLLSPDHLNCLALEYNLTLLCTVVDRFEKAHKYLERASYSICANFDKLHLLTIISNKALRNLPTEIEDAIPYMHKKILVLTLDIGMCILVPPIKHDLVANFFEPSTENDISGRLASGFQLLSMDSETLMEGRRSNYSLSSSPIAIHNYI